MAGRKLTKAEREAGKKQVAEYLASLGVGAVYIMDDLRKLVPGDENIGRRMRDLRDEGWILHSYLDAPDLKPKEYRIVKIGDGVRRKKPVSGALRRQVFDRDNYTCRVCGLAKGETYPDRPDVVKLTVGHLVPQEHNSKTELRNLRTECKRCNEEARDQTPTTDSIEALVTQVKNMKRSDKQQLADWLSGGGRTYTQPEILWAKLAVMPQEATEAVKDALHGFMR